MQKYRIVVWGRVGIYIEAQAGRRVGDGQKRKRIAFDRLGEVQRGVCALTHIDIRVIDGRPYEKTRIIAIDKSVVLKLRIFHMSHPGIWNPRKRSKMSL